MVTILLSGIGTWLTMSLTRRILGNLDVSTTEEEMGLDFFQIGEQAYDDALDPLLDLGEDVLLHKLCDACKTGNFARVKQLIKV